MRRTTRLKRALDERLSPEQYARRRHDTPYLYTLGSGEEALTFVGAHHTTDTTDPVLETITAQLKHIQPDIVFVEGVQNLTGVAGTEQFISGLSDTEAIERGGESIYTVKRALEQNIPWACPEPSDAAVARALVNAYYTREEVVAWYVLRLLGQYHGRSETVPFAAYVAPFLATFEQAVNWEGVTCTAEAGLRTVTRVLGHRVNINNADRAATYTDPIPWPERWEEQTVFNEMTRVALGYRDEVIMKNIARELQAGKRVLVVYGAGHAVMQEPGWRFYFGS